MRRPTRRSWRRITAATTSLVASLAAWAACAYESKRCGQIASPDGGSALELVISDAPDAPNVATLRDPAKSGHALLLPEPVRNPYIGDIDNQATAAAILVRGQGLWLWTEAGGREFRRVSSTLPLGDWASPDTLLYLSDDSQLLFITPLGGSPVVVRMKDGVLVTDLGPHRGTLLRRNLQKSRILLFAEDDLLKLAGLHWAVELQDTRFIALIARYAETGRLPALRRLAQAMVDAFLANSGRRSQDVVPGQH